MNKEIAQLEDLEKSLKRLKEAVALDFNDIVRDSVIQRFEFTFDICWKNIKTWLKECHGVECHSPKSCLKEAFQNGLIEMDDVWMEMVEDRNLTTHMYKESVADEVYKKMKGYVKLFEKVLAMLKKGEQ